MSAKLNHVTSKYVYLDEKEKWSRIKDKLQICFHNFTEGMKILISVTSVLLVWQGQEYRTGFHVTSKERERQRKCGRVEVWGGGGKKGAGGLLSMNIIVQVITVWKA